MFANKVGDVVIIGEQHYEFVLLENGKPFLEEHDPKPGYRWAPIRLINEIIKFEDKLYRIEIVGHDELRLREYTGER